MPLSLIRAVLTVLWLWALGSSPAVAQESASSWPSRPIRIVIAATAGGETDIIARLIAEGLRARFNVNVLVEPRPGAGVVVGSDHVARSAPDGYTLLFGGSGLTISPTLNRTPYDPAKDFTAISEVLNLEFYLVARGDMKAATLQELVAEIKARPAPPSYGTSGVGTITHFQMEMLKSLAGFDAVHVPYKGTAPGLQGILSGDTQLMFVSFPARVHFRTGALRPLAVAMPRRSAAFPDLPTVAEVFAGYDAIGWAGLMGPAGIPRPIVDKLNAAMVSIVADPAFAARIREMGGEPASSTPDAMAERLRRETARYQELARRLGIKQE